MPFPWALWLCRSVQTTAAVLLVGAAALRLLATGMGVDRAAGWSRLAWASWATLLVSGTLQLGLTAAAMSGEPLAQVFANGSVVQVLDGTRFGLVWKARMGLAAGWSVLALVARGFPPPTSPVSFAPKAAETLLAVAVLGSLVFAGHAQASDKNVWLLPTAVAHAVAAGAWPGGLLPLASLLGAGRRDPSLVPAAMVIARRFSRLSVAAVGVLAFSGVLNGVGMIGTLAALWTSPYGRLALCKTTLFALMIGLGAINRRLVENRNPADPPRTLRLLWRNVAMESALAVGVLLATEAMAAGEPPMPT